MSSTALKLLALATLLLALGFGYAAYRMTANVTPPEPALGPDGQPVQTMATVSTKPLTAYKPVPADAVAVVPVAVLPPQFYSRTEEVVGRVPLTDIPVGTTLTERYFTEANTLVRSIPPGYQAMSLEINDVIAVGGFVRPGDLVDVLLYIRASGREVADSQARVLLREARVLAYEERVLNDAEPTGASPGESRPRQRQVRTAVLAVPETDTTRVMLGASLGELRLALRAPDEQAADTLGTMDSSEAPVQEIETVEGLEDADEKVVTLRELADIRQQQTPSGGPGEEPVVVYRGSQMQAAPSQ